MLGRTWWRSRAPTPSATPASSQDTCQALHLGQSTRWPPPSQGTGVVRDTEEKGSEHDAACWVLRKGLWDRGARGWVVTMLWPHNTLVAGDSHMDQ